MAVRKISKFRLPERWRRNLRTYLVTGSLVMVPVVVTFLVLRFVFQSLDGVLKPIVSSVAGNYIPGAGLVALIVLVYSVGLLTQTFFGRKLFALGQSLLLHTPVVQSVYAASKGVMDNIARSGKTPFQRPVLIQYPRQGIWTPGFITAGPLSSKVGELFAVYIPTTPTPMSGFLVMVPEADIMHLEATTQEVLRLIISGGILSPEKL